MTLRHDLEELAKRVYRRIPPDAERRTVSAVARARRLLAPRQPLLSVVMPVYNVERYLPEAVGSVLRQTYLNLELILVDDGSTDSSGALCDELARQDSRIRVIHQPNGGLSAARNTGIAAARGTYLAFADSDDYVAQFAYSMLIAALRRSGSDVATGNVRRRRGASVYQAWNQSRSHLTSRRGVTLDSHPDLLFDTVAWNKVFRTEFWNAHVKTFPVGKLYEDMVPIFTAFQHARSIDVVSRPVYVWRLRDEQDSITQRLLEPRNIDDRFEAIRTIDSMIRAAGQEKTLGEQLSRKVLEGDLWIYVREMHDADEVMIERIRQATLAYWSTASEDARASIPAERRVCYWLLEQDRGREVAEFRRWYATVGERPPTRRAGAAVYLDTSACPVPLDGVPAACLDMTSEAAPVTGVVHAEWTRPTVLTVRGYAYTHAVSDGNQQVQLIATDDHGGEPVEIPAARVAYELPYVATGRTGAPRASDGFAAEIDVTALHGVAGSRRWDTWDLAVRVTDGEITGTVPLEGLGGASPADVGSAVLADGFTASVVTRKGKPLQLMLRRAGVAADSFGVTGTEVRVGFAPAAGDVASVWLGRAGRKIAARREADGSFVAQVPPTGSTRPVVWHVYARVAGRTVAVLDQNPVGSTSAPNSSGLLALADAAGRAVVRAHAGTAVVDRVSAGTTEAVELSGALLALDDIEIGIAAPQGVPGSWHRARVSDGRFEVAVPLTRSVFGPIRPLAAGRYEIRARRPGDRPGSREAALILGSGAAATLPATFLGDTIKTTVSGSAGAPITVEVAAPIADDVLRRSAQTQLIAQWADGPRSIEDAVFFCVDLGSNAGDSALAIHQELRRRGTSLQLYWGVDDLSVPVPEGGIPVLKLSPAWYEKLNTSRYIVNNYGGIWGLAKHPDQRYLQTWHGTPLKLIGASEARRRKGPSSGLHTIARESAEWDAFISPSPYMTSLIRTEFSFGGDVLEIGYPRNDRLATFTTEERAAIRAGLGLPPAAKVLLYAPTFREHQRSGWKAALYEGLPLSRLLDLLGPEWYVLLRGHSFNARADRRDRSHGRVVDVTHHPDINDLYIASDVLLTDYSSVMFDYAVTRRPILFFAPDLDRYEATRGVYFDLREVSPGPIYRAVTDLAAGLRDLDAVTTEYAGRYAAFRERFAPWDDGKAASRAVDAFFSGV